MSGQEGFESSSNSQIKAKVTCKMVEHILQYVVE